MLGTNRPPFIDRRKVRVPSKYDEMGVMAVVCLTLAAAIIILAMALGPPAHSETPTSCKGWSHWCDARKPVEHWNYGNCNLIWQYCDIG